MKLILTFSVGLLLTGSAAIGQVARQVTKSEKIERLLTITLANGDGGIAQMMKSTFAASMPPAATPEQRAKAEEVSQKIIESTRAISDKMRPLFAQFYDEVFSDEEINGILAFYESATGRAMIVKQPLIMSKVMTAILPEIQRLAKEALPK